MTDRVYPSAPKPTYAQNGLPPSQKAQLYNAARPPYRSIHKPSRRRGSCCRRSCLCCIWLSIFVLALLLLAFVAGGVFWLLYRPQSPSFAVASLRFTYFNLTSESVDSRLDLAFSFRNKNSKLVLVYDRSSVYATSGGAQLGNGSFPALEQGAENSTTLKASLSTGGPRDLDPDSIRSIRSDLVKKNNVAVEIILKANARAKVGSLKTSKVLLRVFCRGIVAAIPKRNSTAPAFTGYSYNHICHLKFGIQIWKFQL